METKEIDFSFLARQTGNDLFTPGIWQKHTGDFYRMMGTLRHGETGELMVMLSSVKRHDVFALPASSFCGTTDEGLKCFTRVAEEWIQTFSGKRFPLFNPSPSDIDINDIAHALANNCRFAGHTKHHYSVAQHSWLASYLVPHEEALAALLHDAAEAYLFDATRPLKQFLVNFKQIERVVQNAINQRFGILTEKTLPISDADMEMLATERRDLMPPSDDCWVCLTGYSPVAKPIDKWEPEEAKQRFLARFHELVGEGA